MSDFKKLRLVMNQPYSYMSPRTFVSSISYDAELDVFYVSGLDGEGYRGEVKTLPANFHTHELRDVDPEDVEALLRFQREWGLLTSPEREPLRVETLGTKGMTIAAKPTNEAFEEAEVLFDKLSVRHEDFRTIAPKLMLIGDDERSGAYVFASRAEASETLAYLQRTVECLVEAHTNGYDTWSGIDERNLRSVLGRIEAAMSPYFPHFYLARSERFDPVLPLTIATLAQLVGYLSHDEGYRECKQCHRLFMYKRHRTNRLTRDVRTVYCSDDCKQLASSTAQAERRKKARHAAKQQASRKERNDGTH